MGHAASKSMRSRNKRIFGLFFSDIFLKLSSLFFKKKKKIENATLTEAETCRRGDWCCMLKNTVREVRTKCLFEARGGGAEILLSVIILLAADLTPLRYRREAEFHPNPTSSLSRLISETGELTRLTDWLTQSAILDAGRAKWSSQKSQFCCGALNENQISKDLHLFPATPHSSAFLWRCSASQQNQNSCFFFSFFGKFSILLGRAVSLSASVQQHEWLHITMAATLVAW